MHAPTARYEPAIDLDAIHAIDMHTHVEADGHGHFSLDQELMDASAAYFKSGQLRTPTIDDIAEHYRARNMAAVVFTVDSVTATGHPALSSEEIAAGAARHNDVLIPFGSVDPNTGDLAVERARRLIADHGVRGLKFHPSLQGFRPNDERFYPLYDAMSDLGAIALFHTGQTGIGAGLPGGRGIKLRLSDPMLLDDVAADFPALQIVMAHPGVPWADAAISIATHKANVHMDLSGWLPKYFPQQLVRQLSTVLRSKVLFGSDFPVITPDRWMESFSQLEVKDEAKPQIFKENAARLLGLTG
jgi:predicted TIM-barrel fold metal-dependent hydrolase